MEQILCIDLCCASFTLKKSIIKTSTWFISHLQRVSEGDLVSAGAGAAAELDQSGGGGQLKAVSVLVPACR